MDIIKQLNDASNYIEEHLTDEIDINQLSKITMQSADSFKRFFSYIAGMSMNEYIRRRKLSSAVFDLQNTDLRIIDIAVKYGWSSADSFTRAFVSQHGITPSAARNISSSFRIYPPVSFSITIKGAREMNFAIRNIEETIVYGITRDFDTTADKRFEQENIMWAENLDHIPARICDGYDGIWYAIWHDGKYTIARKKEFVTGKNLDEQKIPAGKYAVFTSERGVYAGEAFPQMHDAIFNSWLPGSGYKQIGDLEIEVYHLCTNREKRRKERFFEIWIPVETAD
ncbi:MAG: helix-turn-helix domain-containing protein [Eubacterium sp.]